MQYSLDRYYHTRFWISVAGERFLSWSLLLASFALILLFGTLKIQDAARIIAFDFHILHEAGKMWITGENPYLEGAAYNAFAYPPTSALFFQLFALLPFELARVIYIVISYLALMLSVEICIKTFEPSFRWHKLPFFHAFSIAVILVNPVTLTVFKFGQTSIVLLCVTLLAWKFYNEKRPLLAACFLAISTIKPQFSLLIIIWLLFQREFRILFIAGVIGVGLMAPLLLKFTVAEIFTDWFSAMSAYRELEHNQWGFQDIAGLQSLFAAFGINTFSLMPLGMFGLVVMYYFRDDIDPRWYFSLFMLISFTFFFCHDYDYVGLLPFWVGFLLHTRSSMRTFLLAMGLIFLFNFPQSLVRKIFGLSVTDISPLLHWRSLVLIAAGGFAIYWSLVDQRSRVRSAQAVSN